MKKYYLQINLVKIFHYANINCNNVNIFGNRLRV